MKERILVVDDELPICTLLAERLSQQGYHCQSSLNGEEALRLLAQEPFDVIISDLRMPGMSGLALLEEVRKEHPHSAFVVATGVDDVRVSIEAMKQGASDYLIKPIQLDSLVASVERSVEKKRLELELESY